MFSDRNMNTSESAATFLTQTLPQSLSLSSSPIPQSLSSSPSPTPQSFEQVSQALAMSILNGNVDAKLADTWALANKGIYNMSPNLSPNLAPSPRGPAMPSQFSLNNNLANLPLQNNVISGSLPSLAALQQQRAVTNNLINDLQLLNLYTTLANNNLNNATIPNRIPQAPFNTNSIGNNTLQMNKPREQNPRKMRQQEQFSANKQRTIYISEVHHDVTEADLAILFSRCGDVVDVRLCGDAHSKMRFAFVEFSIATWTFAIPEALKLNNVLLCGAPIRVQRSKTAIVPIKRDLLPQSEEEMVRCSRTIYACNIDKRFTKMDVQAFFEALVVDESVGADGKVARIKMMADSSQKTNIAFVEFCSDESVALALNKCQGALMGCLPLRVSPSKTPIRTPEEERALKEARCAAMLNQK
eukprot:TRINITY_DN1887_c0_g3_i1.p1 TRINITY_DN1887_c0_g3~~TRINITY_DN1887_c0_g3_i1.p1  ORF type:complete len:414 (-),score=69.03 TRINITY_DN1887_c0_g3_i1:969-2210(-)